MRHRFAGPAIPVAGVAEIAFLAMQVRVNPGAGLVWVGDVLGDLILGVIVGPSSAFISVVG